jgi:thioredoxin reductase
VVVGGGAAGLSGALTLARARRSVLVVDAGHPRNAPADGIHGFLTRDGMPPAEFLAAGPEEVRRYGGEIVDGRVTTATPTDTGFDVTLAGGRTFTARRLLVATGLIDRLPDVDGLAERWGRDVVHCPYCHGWEIRDEPVGVLATGERAVHQAQLFRQWTDQVTLLTHTGPPPTGTEAAELAARGIDVVPGEVAALVVAGDHLCGVRLRDGAVVPLRVLAVSPRMVADPPGLELAEHPMGVGRHVPADPTGKTDVPGVWVAGNVSDLFGQVVGSAAAGVLAGAAVNADLIAEEVRAATLSRRPATL